VEATYPAKHYCLVSVKGDKVELQVINDSGEIVDECTLKVGPSSPAKEELSSPAIADNKTSKEAASTCPCKAKKEGRAKRDKMARARGR